MKHSDYNTMNSIIDDLSADDIEQIRDYANDCRMVGAKRTARYIFAQLKHHIDVRLSMIRVKLVEDFSGCY